MGITTTNLVCNLDARDVSGLSDGDAVTSQLTDQSGHGHDAVVTNAVMRAIGYNRPGLPAIEFNSVDSTLTISGLGLVLNNFTIFVVARPTNAAADFVIAGGAGTTNGMMQQFGGVLKAVGGPVSTVLKSPNQSVSVGNGQTVVYGIRIGTSATRLSMNLTKEDTATAYSATAMGNVQVGWNIAFGSHGGGFTLSGQICQVLIYNAAISDADYDANLSQMVLTDWKTLPRLVVFTGIDSRMAGSENTFGNDCASQMGRRLGPGAWLFNFAVGGQDLITAAANDPAKITAALAFPGVQSAALKTYCQWGCVNDVFLERTQVEAYANLLAWIAAAITPNEASSLRLIIGTEIPSAFFVGGPETYNAQVRANANAICDRLADIGAVYPFSKIDAYKDATYFVDLDTHPNDAGIALGPVSAFTSAILDLLATGTRRTIVIGDGSYGTTTIAFSNKPDGGDAQDVLSAALCDKTNGWGVVRVDTGETVIAAGTEFVRVSEGLYAITFNNPASGLIYKYAVRYTDADGDEQYYEAFVSLGETTTAGEIAAALAGAGINISVGNVNGMSMEIIKGDDYTGDRSRRYRFVKIVGEPWPDDLTGHVITLVATKTADNPNTGTSSLTFIGVIDVAAGDLQAVYFTPTAAQTATLALGIGNRGYSFKVIATDGSDPKTLREGLMTVRA